MELEEFVAKQLDLLSIEKEAEIEETKKFYENVSSKELQKRGVCLLQLRIGYCSTELFNRTVICFEPFWTGKQLPSSKLTSGDIVGVTLQHDEKNVIASGVITKSTANSVFVAFEESFERLGLDENVQYQIIKLANDVTYRRFKSALIDLRKYRGERTSNLIEVLFGNCQPSDPIPLCVDEIKFINKHLDSSQKEAVIFALCQKEIAIIHGPPGTGKTTTLIEFILQAVKQEKKILVCAPSNIAVDNLVERLSAEKISIVRLGHPARVLPTIQQYSLDALISSSDSGALLNDIRKELDSYIRSSRPSRNEKQKSHSAIHSLRKELREREVKTMKELLQKCAVVLCTLTSAYEDGPLKHLRADHFDVLVIDECSQGIEAACWIPMLKVPKCVIAGDHFQLPPTIVSEKAAKNGLEISLMERLIKIHGDAVTKMLNIQYRMHTDIMQWSSNHFYKGELVADSAVKTHLLCGIPQVENNEDTNIPLLLIDTAGCDLQELDTSEEESKGNEGEADIVAHHINELISSGVNQKDIAVITPYNLQVELLRMRLHSKHPDLEIKSVDGFQGREKEAVVISLVRSNTKGEVGFLSELRRLNVAVTRARRHATIVCNSETLSSNAGLKSFIDYISSNGEVRSAEQYRSVINSSVCVNRSNILKKVTQEKDKSAKTNKNREKKLQKKEMKDNKVPEKEKFKKTIIEHKDIQNLQRDNYIHEKLNEEIQTFIKNSTLSSYSFPATLSSFERRLIHEIAEKEKLLHTSQGEGENRYIIITKPTVNNKLLYKEEKDEPTIKENKFSSELAINEVELDENDENLSTSTEENNMSENAYGECSLCHKSMPKENLLVHELRCQKTVNKRKPAEKTLSRKLEKSKTKPEELPEDFDQLMAAVAKENRICHFQKCKTSTVTLGQICQFCKLKFCLTHIMPEIHGCGDEARKQAKQKMIQEHAQVGKKKLNPIHRIHLQRKLDKKLTEMADERKAKKK